MFCVPVIVDGFFNTNYSRYHIGWNDDQPLDVMSPNT